ncbi:ERI1 exoribonuclease 3-like [Corticium candelabrum]|uniref:ERI1 exoribonuclease 3-like n=1 Tax=Corticium candelabrum TaxID=121492 RepID=UPI002E272861|nr:ERI1 exoribonuclease 3-like [Corticium candelabrum]
MPYYDYFLVLDFQATCDDKVRVYPQEVIEFPVLLFNARTFATEDVFHTYVTPTVHPRLSAFCTKLTGITQDKVDGQPTLHETMQRFHEWMASHGLLDPSVKSCFVTCGDWDLKTMLPSLCTYLKLSIPDYFRKWVNIKKVFQRTFHKPKLVDMVPMLDDLGLQLDGRHHSGIDDSKNIAKILIKILEKGVNLRETMTLPPFEVDAAMK